MISRVQYTLRFVSSPLSLSHTLHVIMLSARCKNAVRFERVNKILRKYSTVFFHSSVDVSFVACWLHILPRYYSFCKAITIKLTTPYHMHFNMSREFRIKSQFFLHFYLFFLINFHNLFSCDCRSLSCWTFHLIWNGTVETHMNNRCLIRFDSAPRWTSQIKFSSFMPIFGLKLASSKSDLFSFFYSQTHAHFHNSSKW